MRRNYTVILGLVVVIALIVFWYEEHKTEQSVYQKHVITKPAETTLSPQEAQPLPAKH